MKDHNLRFARLLLLVNGLVPLLLLGWDALHHRLGANPPKYAIHTTGMLALVFLVLTMAAFVTALVPINSNDIWWHLKTGDYIRATGALPATCHLP